MIILKLVFDSSCEVEDWIYYAKTQQRQIGAVINTTNILRYTQWAGEVFDWRRKFQLQTKHNT
jgi:hypothetical protein